MFDDPIVQEIREARNRIAEKHDYDVHKMFNYWRGMEQERNKDNRFIELYSAIAFLKLYNKNMDAQYKILDWDDSPDFVCRDQEGNELKIEITLTQDKEHDIQAILESSNLRNAENVILQMASCLQTNVMEMLIETVRKKLSKQYGSNTALVIRDASPLDWDWSMMKEQIMKRILEILESNKSFKNPFDKGIWILTNSKDAILKMM